MSKKFLIVGLSYFITASSFAANIELGIAGPANCRKTPVGKIVTSIPDAGRVQLLERKGDWYRVRYKDQNCWTNAKAKKVIDGIQFNFFWDDSRPVKSEDVIHFACDNIPNNRFLLNKDGTKVCWIHDPTDYNTILVGLKLPYKSEDTMVGKRCPGEFASVGYCDPKKLRDF
ncbi:MAG: hypothetical protein JST80_03135 [Bdellovibrionales bacterium]|nr:hypothetical protein [Bdellovibrionales bacterium]